MPCVYRKDQPIIASKDCDSDCSSVASETSSNSVMVAVKSPSLHHTSPVCDSSNEEEHQELEALQSFPRGADSRRHLSTCTMSTPISTTTSSSSNITSPSSPITDSTYDGDCCLSQQRRQMNSSPMPSPHLQRRVMTINKLKMVRHQLSTPLNSRSPTHFRTKKNALLSDSDSNADDDDTDRDTQDSFPAMTTEQIVVELNSNPTKPVSVPHDSHRLYPAQAPHSAPAASLMCRSPSSESSLSTQLSIAFTGSHRSRSCVSIMDRSQQSASNDQPSYQKVAGPFSDAFVSKSPLLDKNGVEIAPTSANTFCSNNEDQEMIPESEHHEHLDVLAVSTQAAMRQRTRSTPMPIDIGTPEILQERTDHEVAASKPSLARHRANSLSGCSGLKTPSLFSPLTPSPLGQRYYTKNEGSISPLGTLAAMGIQPMAVTAGNNLIKGMNQLRLDLAQNDRRRRDSLSPMSNELYGSLVGSYEESILTGRLSTPPSKPIRFICQIGALCTEAKCPSWLRCPPHVTIPFSASFYDWNRQHSNHTSVGNLTNTPATPLSPTSMIFPITPTIRRSSTASDSPSTPSRQHSITSQDSTLLSPSNHSSKNSNFGSMTEELGTPFVGTVDLDWGLGPLNSYGYAHNDEKPKTLGRSDSFGTITDSCSNPAKNLPKHRSPFDPKDGLRIPLSGQLQIMIRNPTKSVVKVFLIPYDFRDMPIDTRTFIRQKTIICPRAPSQEQPHDVLDKDEMHSGSRAGLLRHAIHLSFVCLSLPATPVSSAETDPGPGHHFPASTPSSSSVEDASSVLSSSQRIRRKTKKQEKCVYLHRSIRVVFGHRATDAEGQWKEQVNIVTEGPHGNIDGETTSEAPKYLPIR